VKLDRRVASGIDARDLDANEGLAIGRGNQQLFDAI
jgi:hypothetical protein